MLTQPVKVGNFALRLQQSSSGIMIKTMIAFLVFLLLVWSSVLTYFIFFKKTSPRPSPAVSSKHFRFSLVRFNPFTDTGGEQSFVVSLLDGGGNGILLTSLHGRGVSRMYAKKITAGKTNQELSREESQALREALAESETNS